MRLIVCLLSLFHIFLYANFPATQQLVIVIASDWNSSEGVMSYYERHAENASWNKCRGSIPVFLGKAGLGLGIGVHASVSDFPEKKEGDKKSPAGIFRLGSAFGYAENLNFKMPYLLLQADTEAVDDPHSRYYNKIVNRSDITNPDWTSSELMRSINQYELGLVILHNASPPIVGKGSAIFMHIVDTVEPRTTGCTAMRREDLLELLQWLDASKQPLLIQSPREMYLLLGLPELRP